jgi:hypothetical protein
MTYLVGNYGGAGLLDGAGLYAPAMSAIGRGRGDAARSMGGAAGRGRGGSAACLSQPATHQQVSLEPAG